MSASTFECSLVIHDEYFFSRPLTLPFHQRNSCVLTLIHRQKNVNLLPVRDSLSTHIFPRCAWMRPLGNRQPQTHSGSVPVHAHKILKNLLMMFRCDAGPSPLRLLPRCSGAAIETCAALPPEPGPPHAVPKCGAARSVTLPPLGVCFNALSSRFAAACCTF